MRTCPFCAEAIQDAAIVCKHCGRDIAAQPSTAKVKPTSSGLKWWALGLLTLAAIAFNLRSPDTNRSPTSSTASSAPSTGNPAHDTLQRLSEVDINRSLAKVLAREDCGTVEKNYYQGMDPQKVAFWNAGCSSGRYYAITLKPDGSSRILECNMLRAVAKVECFLPLGQAAR